jgi:hypothetical protein
MAHFPLQYRAWAKRHGLRLDHCGHSGERGTLYALALDISKARCSWTLPDPPRRHTDRWNHQRIVPVWLRHVFRLEH